MAFDKRKNHKIKHIPQTPRGQIWIYGEHPFKAVLLNKKRQIFKILITKNNQQDLEKFIKENNLQINKKLILIVNSNDDIAANFSNKVIHQGFSVLCSTLSFSNDNDFLASLKQNEVGNIVVLDQLTDPHNIGAIIRSAAAFNVDKIILSKQTFGGENATICKSSSGVIENVQIILAGNINNFILKLKEYNYWVLGLDGYGSDNFQEIRKYDKICLIVGSEGDGIRHLVKKNCDLLLKIPTSNKVESLNASNAAAIALYEINKSN